jgi:hypothetical protein
MLPSETTFDTKTIHVTIDRCTVFCACVHCSLCSGAHVFFTGLAYRLAFFLPSSHARTSISRQRPCPTVGGVRLSAQEGQTLPHLCATTPRPPRDVLRLLVHLAHPPDLPAVQCAASSAASAGQCGVCGVAVAAGSKAALGAGQADTGHARATHDNARAGSSGRRRQRCWKQRC